jgi:hypothetical protein
MVPVAAARAAATWTGASTSPEWGQAVNWSGTPPASNTSSPTLTFPTLNAWCATCYTSHNGLTGVSTLGLAFTNTAGQYRILGNTLRVGSRGISDSPGAGTATTINAPLVLSSPQTWTVGAVGHNGYNVLTLLGGISATANDALTMAFPGAHDADLFVDSDMEVGPVTVTGTGGLHIGSPTKPGSLNGSDGQSVTINGAILVANPGSTSGPLTVGNGTLLLGTNLQNNGATTLHVNGAAQVASSTTTQTFINGNGTTPGTDFSQLSASGNITIGGQLTIGHGPNNSGSCVTLNPGDVATLITSAGTLSGTFTNAPEGALLNLAAPCTGTPSQVRINYTAHSATATVLGGPSPTSTPVPPPNPARARKRRGRILGPRGRLTVIRRRTRVVEKCQSSVLCRGRFTLAATLRSGRHHTRRTLRCASAGFRIRANRSATTRARVAGACLRLLRRARRHRLSVTYTSRATTGQTGQRKRVTLVLR